MKIFAPIGVPVRPEYKDGVDNLLTRQGRVQTQSLVLVTLAQIDLAPGLFSIAPNAVLNLQIIGRWIGAAGTKRLVVSLDGVTSILDTGNAAFNNLAFHLFGQLYFDGSNLGWFLRYCHVAINTLFTSLATDNGANNSGVAFNPAIAHTLLLQALVANAADTVSLDWTGASFR